MANNYDSIWNDTVDIAEAKTSERAPVFKLKEAGEKARICLPLINPKTQRPALKKYLVFNYSSKTSDEWARYFAPEDKECEAYKVSLRNCGEPQVVYATTILQYSANTKGRLLSGDDYELKVLKITSTRLKALQAIQDEYNLAEVDLAVVLKEPKFQAIDFNATKGCGLRDGKILQSDGQGKSREIEITFNKEQVLKEAIDLLQNGDSAIADKWTENQILEFFKVTPKDEEDFDDDNSNDNGNDDDLDDDRQW